MFFDLSGFLQTDSRGIPIEDFQNLCYIGMSRIYDQNGVGSVVL
ncbi:hypothetical protein HMPREF9372_3418 [Sporosarcina newyorkensis 2681]|uniref:Uncharacterized protein n=1 Tax=Sporosarcina newyorkensis 2681 TaxID=1027292 RepID=F9DX87_9BACL|nr:hypothetical protein HMPREF9372_3418 [Sporosarcina newyorkensis 2681]